MAPANLFTLVYDALLRPARFGAWLSGGHRNVRLAVLATLEVLIAALAFVALVLEQLLPLGTPRLLVGLGLAPVPALLLAGFWMVAGSGQELAPGANAAFWILRCQITITPPLAPLLAVMYSIGFAWLQAAAAALLLLLLFFGLWVGGALTVHLALHSRRSEATAVR